LNGELTPLSKLSSAFLTPKDSEHLLFAYYESSLVVEFLVQQFGFDTLKAILQRLREGVSINDAIAAQTLPLPALEDKFAAFVQERANDLAPGADLARPPATHSVAERAAWEKSHPDNYYVRMQKARELMNERKWAEAETKLESVARMYSGERRAENPLWLLAETQRNLSDTNAELATLQKLARQESDFADLYVRLIELSRACRDWAAVAEYSRQLLAIDPLISLPYRALAEAGVASGNSAEAITGYRKLLLLDPPDPAMVHYQLARLLHARGDADREAKRHVLQSLEEAPRYRDAQRLLLEIENPAPAKAGEKAPERNS
jgi:tetratricopeptide (TPR) repeat protein